MSVISTLLRKHYGFEPPYDFKVAIPFMLSMILLITVLSVSCYLASRGDLLVGSNRFYFFLYIVILLLISASLSRLKLLWFATALWSVMELGLALASHPLESAGVATSLFPRNIFASTPDPRFEYHPILGIVPKPNTQGEWHPDRRNIPLAGLNLWWINPSAFNENAFSHNSLGLRGREFSSADLSKDLIFAYGGSTTYDYSVTQGSTWIEQLESALGNRFTIVNFGVPAHSTTQHLIYTAFYQNAVNKNPVCSLYYVGINDLWNSHANNLDPMYANYLSLFIHGMARKPDLLFANYSPLVRLADTWARRRFDSVREAPPGQSTHTSSGDDRLEKIFVEHLTTIAAINASRSIKTIFIGQVLNMDRLSSAPPEPYYHASMKNEAIWPLQERLNSILAGTATSVGAAYIDAGASNFNNNDFSDVEHFTAAGSARFAALISKQVEDHCR